MIVTSDQIDEVAKALAAAQAEFSAVGKSNENRQQGYSYADLADYHRAVREGLKRHQLALTGSVVSIQQLAPRTTARGGKMLQVRAHVVLRLLHPSGQWIESAAYGDGEDANDKAAYKAITGARKYAIASLLGLATTDDPERDAPAPEPVPTATDEQRQALQAWADSPDISEAARKWITDKVADPALRADAAAEALARLDKQQGKE